MKKVLQFLTIAILLANEGQSCTGIRLTAADQTTVNGRTLEFGIPIDASVALLPRGTLFNTSGLKFTSKYAVLGAITFDSNAVADGFNEKGLTVGTFYFPGFAKYTEVTAENSAHSLSPIDFPNWILTQFATLDEVRQAVPTVVIADTVIKGWGDAPPPFHYVVYDKEGKSIVIEPLEGKLVISDNILGTFTNSPTFEWHLTHLRNYINLTVFDAKPIDLEGLVLAPFGSGSGMVGIPGDFTPPSRFVRAAIYSATAIPSRTHEEAVFQAFHILNQFDIPVGSIRDKKNGKVYTDSTLFTSVKDPISLKYYYRSYGDQSIRVVDMTQFDLNAKGIKKFNMSADVQPVTDVSAKLQS